MKLAIEVVVGAPLQRVWDAWVTPADIRCWNFASDDWTCPSAEVDLSEGGKFSYRMEARDGSVGFDFEGTFRRIQPHRRIDLELSDGRAVRVEFSETDEGVRVVETFDIEDAHSADQQRQGWQSILDRFKKHVESRFV